MKIKWSVNVELKIEKEDCSNDEIKLFNKGDITEIESIDSRQGVYSSCLKFEDGGSISYVDDRWFEEIEEEGMKEFEVLVREVWIQRVVIEAKTQEEAIEKVREGEGINLQNGLEYSHTLDFDTWTVEE